MAIRRTVLTPASSRSALLPSALRSFEHVVDNSRSVLLAGTSTLIADGYRGQFGQVTLSGSSDLFASGILGHSSSVTLAGGSSLSAAGTRQLFAGAALAGSSNLAADGTLTQGETTVQLDGSSSLSATGARGHTASAALTGGSSLTADGTRRLFAGATLQGSGSLVAGGTVGRIGSVTLAGGSSLAADGTVTGGTSDYDTDAQAYITAVDTARGSLSLTLLGDAEKSRIDRIVRNLKGDNSVGISGATVNFWTNLQSLVLGGLNVGGGSTLLAAKGGHYTLVNGPIWTSTGVDFTTAGTQYATTSYSGPAITSSTGATVAQTVGFKTSTVFTTRFWEAVDAPSGPAEILYLGPTNQVRARAAGGLAGISTVGLPGTEVKMVARWRAVGNQGQVTDIRLNAGSFTLSDYRVGGPFTYTPTSMKLGDGDVEIRAHALLVGELTTANCNLLESILSQP